MLLLHLVTLQSDVKLRHHVSWPKQDQICPYSLTGVQVPWSSLGVEMRNWSDQIVKPIWNVNLPYSKGGEVLFLLDKHNSLYLVLHIKSSKSNLRCKRSMIVIDDSES